MTDQVNPKKLYVGNLPYSTTEDELRSMFSEFGEIVDVKLISDKFTGRSKGFAFVEFATEEAAQAALEAMNGKQMGERAMNVTVARPIQPRENSYRGGSSGGSRGGFGGGSRGGFGGDRRGGDRGGRSNNW